MNSPALTEDRIWTLYIGIAAKAPYLTYHLTNPTLVQTNSKTNQSSLKIRAS